MPEGPFRAFHTAELELSVFNYAGFVFEVDFFFFFFPPYFVIFALDTS